MSSGWASGLGCELNADAVRLFQAEGGQSGALPAGLNAVVVVVLNAAQTEAVLLGAGGAIATLPQGAVVIACATVPPAFAREMEARCAVAGVHYLDAPISGGAVKAAQGALSIMAAGQPEAFAAARPVLDACAQTVFELGAGAGPGSAMKAANQLLAGIHIAAMAEARAALDWLRHAGAERFFWKHCSTVDSTATGNIGPVAEALMADLGCAQTIYCPAFPENGRMVFMGNLLVGRNPLAESPMNDHPLTPMRDSNLLRLLSPQVQAWSGWSTGCASRRGQRRCRPNLPALRRQGPHM